MRYWILPEDVIELLPENAEKIEHLRRLLLDAMHTWGYRFVVPPLVEFQDSLLAGSGEDLDLQTFKLTDQQSGRMMGVRADFTPQIARIDASRLPTDGVSRFAYCGDVLRTKSESTEPRRNPIIIGAELYGVSELTGDVEIMTLMCSLLNKVGIHDSLLDIGHSGIYAGMVQLHHLNATQQQEVHDVLSGVRRPDLKHWKDTQHFSEECINDIRFLVDAPLASDVLAALKAQFAGRHALFDRAIHDIDGALKLLKTYLPQQKISLDLTNVGSYGYHSGLLFAVYAPGHYDSVARGGRYDGVGEVYGRARPATGFSADLLTLAQLLDLPNRAVKPELVPLPANSEAFKQIAARRDAGEVICFEHKETP